MSKLPACRNLLPQSAALLLVVAALGCSNSNDKRHTDNKPAKPVAVKTVAVVEQDVQRTSAQPATIHAYYRAEVRAKVSGYVKEVRADIGDFVKVGATLALIDIPEMQKERLVIQARIDRGESEEKRAAAGVELATANIQSAEATLEQAKSEARRAGASLAAAEAEYSRTRDLVERRSLERRVLDEVRKKRDSEIANKDAVESAIRSAEAGVAVAQARRSSAQADVEAAQADTAIARRQLEELDVLLAYAELKAPFAGVVTHRTVDPGDLVRESSEVGKGEPLFVVSQIDRVRVHIPVPEVDAAMVTRGDAVTLTFPSFAAEESLAATITRLAGELEPSTRTMLVEAELSNAEGKLIPGMFGQATIELSAKVAANMLPARAIRFTESGEAYVYLVDETETVSVVPITTGYDNGRFIEVASGAEKGQRVIDAHLKRFTDGQKVSRLD